MSLPGFGNFAASARTLTIYNVSTTSSSNTQSTTSRTASTSGAIAASASRSSTPQAPLKSAVRFQLLSDLHLELSPDPIPKIPHTAPHLILAGDINKLAPSNYPAYLAFLTSLAPHYERIFLILGNHEFYGGSIDEGLDAARRLEGEEALRGRVCVMWRRRVDLDIDRNGQDGDKEGEGRGKVTVLGCTMWSHIPSDSRKRVSLGINDFRQIDDWTVDGHNAAHAADVAWLKAQLTDIAAENRAAAAAAGPGVEKEKRRVLIITHHVPTLSPLARAPKHKDSPFMTSFQTDVLGDGDGGFDWAGSGVKVWACGHTHQSFRIEEKGVLVVSNQRGYESGREGLKALRFDAGMVVEV